MLVSDEKGLTLRLPNGKNYHSFRVHLFVPSNTLTHALCEIIIAPSVLLHTHLATGYRLLDAIFYSMQHAAGPFLSEREVQVQL